MYWLEFQVASKTHNSSNTVEVYFLYMVQCWSSKHVSRDPLYSHWDTQGNRSSITFNMWLPTLSWGPLSFQTTEKGREYGEVCISGLYGSLLHYHWLNLRLMVTLRAVEGGKGSLAASRRKRRPWGINQILCYSTDYIWSSISTFILRKCKVCAQRLSYKNVY